MGYTLIITEKPAASKKIADALAEGKPIKESLDQVPYYKITRGKNDYVVIGAVGHLYVLDEKEKSSWKFPVFDIEWKEAGKIRKSAKFSSKYLKVIKKLAKDADNFIIATDLDIEGETIGLNILRYACKQKDAERMKFSTLTKEDLIQAFNKRSPTIEWGLANAGETRHFLDFYNGISYSRALTSSIKSAGAFKVMSTGRVQGPALKIIVDREKEIKAFKPVPFWQIELLGHVNKGDVIAWHEKDKFWEKKEAEQVMEKVKNEKKAAVDKVEKKKFNQSPPVPFDLTTLQTESYRVFRIAPKETLSIAQELYTSGYISYPRTSSQILSDKLGFKKLFEKLSKQKDYTDLVQILLSKGSLKPNNGKKTDPAHPAIYPTGIEPKSLKDHEKKVYDLIVKRFMATFSEAAVRQTVIIDINCNNEVFIAKGTTTLERGWHVFYDPYVKIEEEELPLVEKGDVVDVKKITLHDKETQPPKRYTPASIIRELEKRNLGTKCLTSNNLVKINSNNQIHNENIAELFNRLYRDFPVPSNDNMKIALNSKKICFSFNEFDEIRSNFNSISKRKLNKNEGVYRIQYFDGSYAELTEDHPILMFNGTSCNYIRVKNLREGMKSVTSVRFPEKNGDIICSWENFLKKCNAKTKLYGISNELKTQREKHKLSQNSFGAKYGINQSSICVYETSKNIPLYIFKRLNLSKPDMISSVNKNCNIKNPFPFRMSSSLARILANLVGDCSIDSEKILRENCYDFRYHNTDINLINRFVMDVRKVFGVSLTLRIAKEKEGHLKKYYVKLPAVVGRIISLLFPEVINKNAVKIPEDFYPNYIGSLFDDEGHSTKSELKIFISNTNFELLENIKDMLNNLKINSLISKKQFKLYIRGRQNLQKFLEKIPIASITKKQRIIDYFSKFYKFGRNQSSLKKQLLIMNVINCSNKKELTNREISEKLGFEMTKSIHHLNLLIKNGYIKKGTKGISKYSRKEILYGLNKPVEETFFKYINESVVSPDFITKTISSISKIKYQGFVYDITNNQENPNFILSNGVVVHNSTRATIVDTLFQRGYVDGKSIQATDLGIQTLETLEKYTPKIVDEKLTRHFEEELEKVMDGKFKPEEILTEAKEAITKIISDFKKNEENIGKDLLKAHKETRNVMTTLGKCPKCGKGDLVMRKGKFGSFAACNLYPKCKTTYSLPGNALIKPAKKECEICGFPKVIAIKKKKKPEEFCVNPECKSKHVEGEAGKLAKKIAKGHVEKSCPKCEDGKLVLRKSIYGSFLGCNKYPKCKTTEKLENNNSNKSNKGKK